MSISDTEKRIQHLLDDELSSEEFAQLEAELLESPAALELYLSYTKLQCGLERQGSFDAALVKMPVVAMTQIIAEQRRRMIKKSMLAAAAIVILMAVSMWFVNVTTPSNTLASIRFTPDSNFSIVHEGDGEKPDGKALAEGSRLRLTEGIMEGEFASGVKFVVKAPCELKVLAKDRVALKLGLAWFSVPHEAVGFTVETPELKVVDLGTTFGVAVSPSHRSEVHVTKGSVKASVLSSDTAGLVLPAGKALQINSLSKLEAIPINGELFITALPETAQITIGNHSFEGDRNNDPNGLFAAGDIGHFRGELSAWTFLSGEHQVHLGWEGISSDQLHPYPAIGDRKSQALSLIAGASVLNVTETRWSSLNAGDKLTLTLSLGMRAGNSDLNWNEGTFFGLTDGSFPPSGIPKVSDAVTHSEIFSANPATGNQSGDGTFVDVSLSYTVRPADLQRSGMIGILISSTSSDVRERTYNQAFFDNVRLKWTAGKTPAP